MRLQDQVREFHEAFGQPVQTKPMVPAKERIELRRKLHNEEHDELDEELCAYSWSDRGKPEPREIDICGVAKELVDVVYVAYGTALEFGIDLDAVFGVVHASNLAKRWPDGTVHKREDGKILKPPGWKAPDIEGEPRKQGWTP